MSTQKEFMMIILSFHDYSEGRIEFWEYLQQYTFKILVDL